MLEGQHPVEGAPRRGACLSPACCQCLHRAGGGRQCHCFNVLVFCSVLLARGCSCDVLQP